MRPGDRQFDRAMQRALEGAAPAPSFNYLVQEFRPSGPGQRAHWRDVLTTADKAEAERTCKLLAKGRIETFKRRAK